MNKDKMELEEAIKKLKLMEYKYTLTNNDDKAIETVLQALENKDNEIQDLKAVNAMQEYRINEMDIPKKKIEDKYKELKKTI